MPEMSKDGVRPNDFLSKEKFDSLSRFIIPKNEIQAQTITVNCLGYKISEYPHLPPQQEVQEELPAVQPVIYSDIF